MSTEEHYRRQLETLQIEYEEYRESTQEYELALEKEINDLSTKHQQSERERNEWKEKYLAGRKEWDQRGLVLETELEVLRKEALEMKRRTMELEIRNDELEGMQRQYETSLGDLQKNYNMLLEQKVLAEQELRKKLENWEIEGQRLKDELRETNEELAILNEKLQQTLCSNSSQSDLSLPTPSAESSNNSIDQQPITSSLPPEIPSSPPAITPKKSRNSLRRQSLVGASSSPNASMPATPLITKRIMSTETISVLTELLNRAKSLEVRVGKSIGPKAGAIPTTNENSVQQQSDAMDLS